eukprot:m.50116 g.50116  ORF g.50116 m.50116 type:complete len:651 (-) comp13394_c0_seq1:148-2100(-)
MAASSGTSPAMLAIMLVLLACIPAAYYIGSTANQTVDGPRNAVLGNTRQSKTQIPSALGRPKPSVPKAPSGETPSAAKTITVAPKQQVPLVEPSLDSKVEPSSLHLPSATTFWPHIAVPQRNTPTGEAQEEIDPHVEEPSSIFDTMPGDLVPDLSDVPTGCKWLNVVDLPGDKLGATVHCRGIGGNRSCMYENMFYGNQDFFTIQLGKPLPPLDQLKVNTKGKFGSQTWVPKREFAGNAAEARKRIQSKDGRIIVCPHTTLHFGTMFSNNPGHGLWDGLYPAFLAAIRFGYAATPLRLVPTLDAWKGDCAPGKTMACQAKLIMEQFGGRGLIRHPVLKAHKAAGVPVYFERFIVGSGQMAQRWTQTDMSIPGGRSLDGMRRYRDRMFWSHNMTYRPWVPKRTNRAVRAFIVDNKRYSSSDKAAMKLAVDTLKIEGIDVVQMSWASYWPFAKQLEVLGSSDIYITGPGTGMMLAPFMPDGSVVINLLSQRKCYGRTWPHPMEEYILEGSPHLRALYYNGKERLTGFTANGLMGLIRRAVNLTRTGFTIPVPKRTNLSPEGHVLVEACDLAPVACNQMVKEMNGQGGPYQCVNDAWFSYPVYEVGGYDLNYSRPDGKNVSCTVPRDEIRMLRTKYADQLAGMETFSGSGCSS